MGSDGTNVENWRSYKRIYSYKHKSDKMKKSILRLALAVVLMLNIAAIALAQQPKAEKDTVNADKAAKPVFYQAAEEETKSGVPSYVYFVGGLVVAAGIFYLARKKKK